MAIEDRHMKDEKEIFLDLYDLNDGVHSKTGKVIEIKIERSVGRIAAYLLDESGMAPLPNMAYELWLDDELVIEGETDDKGYLCHENMLDDYYKLKVCDEEYGIGTIGQEEEPSQICIIEKDYSWIDDEIKPDID